MKSKDKIPKGIAAALLAAVAVIAAKQLDKAPPPKVKVKVERLVDNPITRRIPVKAEKLIDDPAPTMTLTADEREFLRRAGTAAGAARRIPECAGSGSPPSASAQPASRRPESARGANSPNVPASSPA